MLTKILAGVLAAVAVATAGVYYAYPDAPATTGCGKSAATTATDDAPCCSLKAKTAAKPPVAFSCCSEEHATPTEPLAAFAGAVTAAVPTR